MIPEFILARGKGGNSKFLYTCPHAKGKTIRVDLHSEVFSEENRKNMVEYFEGFIEDLEQEKLAPKLIRGGGNFKDGYTFTYLVDGKEQSKKMSHLEAMLVFPSQADMIADIFLHGQEWFETLKDEEFVKKVTRDEQGVVEVSRSTFNSMLKEFRSIE